jgi:hypothetical protein
MKKNVNYCIAKIRATLAANREIFGGLSDFDFQVNKIREASDEGYNLVALRTNEAETGVAGILGDGMIWYPHPWCTVEQCFEIGPWGKFCVVVVVVVVVIMIMFSLLRPAFLASPPSHLTTITHHY